MPVNQGESPPPEYPGRNLVGQTRRWEVPGEADEDTRVLKAQFLGFSSSRSDRHRHPKGTTARAGERCSGCRWTEFRIFRGVDGPETRFYFLHTVGKSVVPGETDFPRLSGPILTAAEVISHLTRRRPGTTPFLTVPADMVLAQASHFDLEMKDAYSRRAVH